MSKIYKCLVLNFTGKFFVIISQIIFVFLLNKFLEPKYLGYYSIFQGVINVIVGCMTLSIPFLISTRYKAVSVQGLVRFKYIALILAVIVSAFYYIIWWKIINDNRDFFLVEVFFLALSIKIYDFSKEADYSFYRRMKKDRFLFLNQSFRLLFCAFAFFFIFVSGFERFFLEFSILLFLGLVFFDKTKGISYRKNITISLYVKYLKRYGVLFFVTLLSVFLTMLPRFYFWLYDKIEYSGLYFLFSYIITVAVIINSLFLQVLFSDFVISKYKIKNKSISFIWTLPLVVVYAIAAVLIFLFYDILYKFMGVEDFGVNEKDFLISLMVFIFSCIVLVVKDFVAYKMSFYSNFTNQFFSLFSTFVLMGFYVFLFEVKGFLSGVVIILLSSLMSVFFMLFFDKRFFYG